MKEKKLFIGSSVENLDTAYAIQENLEHDAICTVWNQGIFDLTSSALDSLLKATENYEYAIFIFAPDDITKIRNYEYKTVRDNLIFELGLFIGRLGKENVFFLIPREIEKLHLPTDLLGIEPGSYKIPEDENLLRSVLGPFCTKVRRIIKQSTNEENEKKVPKDLNKKQPTTEPIRVESKQIENGVHLNTEGKYTISVAPTVFFSYRVAKAFPGIRNLKWFDNPSEAVDRLEILLRNPLVFDEAIGHGVRSEPIWWSRGYSDLAIHKFRRISDTKCLMDVEELEISKIAVYHSDRYWQNFVYVEVNGEKPIGVYDSNEEDIEKNIEEFGYYNEEYGLYNGVPITRTSYDDGAAEIEGKVVDTIDAELRIRYLSKYNFVIASSLSPIASQEFEKYSEKEFNKILKGDSSIENMIEFIKRLPRHRYDD